MYFGVIIKYEKNLSLGTKVSNVRCNLAFIFIMSNCNKQFIISVDNILSAPLLLAFEEKSKDILIS